MLHLHSFLRWAVLILLVISIIKSYSGWLGKKEFSKGDDKLGLYLMLFTHLQFVLGIVLYFTLGWFDAPFAESMKESASRFWKIEHLVGMLLAVALITIGRIRTKKAEEALKKHKNSAIFYTIALILILGSIPWEMSRMF